MRNIIVIIFAIFLLLQVGCATSKNVITPKEAKSPSLPHKEINAKTPDSSKLKEFFASKHLNDSIDKIYPEVLKAKYNIALLLPLYLSKEDLNKNEKNAASISQDFYKGFLLGVDTLKHCGVNLEIFVLDIDRSFSGRERLKDTLKKLDIDLVIGPLMESELKKYVPFCNSNKMNLVAPVASLDSCFDKTYYIESNPGYQTYGRDVANLIKKNYTDSRIFLVNERTTNHNSISKEFVNQKIGDSLHIIDYKGQGSITFTGFKGFTEKNVIFIPSRNEVFVSSLMSQLQTKDTMGYEFTIIGLYPWLYFKSFEGSVWEQFHLHIACPFFIDYTRKEVKNLIQNFRFRYNEEPSEYSFRGYDEITYFGKMLTKYGKYFQRGFTKENDQSLHTNYHFEKFDNCTGYRNTGLHLIKFEDYEFKKISQ